jgi:hypothetical protein
MDLVITMQTQKIESTRLEQGLEFGCISECYCADAMSLAF